MQVPLNNQFVWMKGKEEKVLGYNLDKGLACSEPSIHSAHSSMPDLSGATQLLFSAYVPLITQTFIT